MLPYFSQNPYQVLLKKGLMENGVETAEGQMNWKIHESANRANVDVIHFHWLHPWTARTRLIRFLYEFPKWKRQIAKLKREGKRIIWTVHNLKDHENRSPYADRLFCQHMANACDAMICHSDQASEEAARFYKISSKKIHTIPHGNYVGWYKNDINKIEARKRLGIPIDAKVIVALGEIRPYKNTLGLIHSFQQADIANSYLVIAGRCKDPNHQNKIETAIANDTRIKTYLDYIPDDDVQLYMNASDIAALPYRDILTSGAALLAMSFNLPLLAPKLRCFEESPGTQGAVLYDDNEDGLVSAISSALAQPDRLASMGAFNANEVTRFDWHDIAKRTVLAYGRSLSNETATSNSGSVKS